MPAPDLSDAAIAALLDTFYQRVRIDPLLGPVFNGAVADWPAHLAVIGDFWSSVMVGTGRYKGNPVAVHRRHAAAMQPELFARWLAIWTATTNDMLPAPLALAMQGKADRIAESLRLAIEFAPPGQRR